MNPCPAELQGVGSALSHLDTGDQILTPVWCKVVDLCCVSSEYTWSYFGGMLFGKNTRQVGKEVGKTTLFVKCMR